ncbi:hypothetical protein AB0J83_04305 [Actinoplanes sp. NPDC049596]|uniref:hypothetical protein n=1 Tax=unclassified Actinoplanes TaxID=2626549 RepID=UPI003443FF1A
MVFVKTQREGSNWLHLGGFSVMEMISGVSRDELGHLRDDIRFHLLRNAEDVISQPLPKPRPALPPRLSSEEELWELIDARAKTTSGKRKRATRTSRNRRVSDPVLTEYVLQRAINHGGTCESCGISPGWTDDFGRPHFQAHHIDPDIDLVDWIGAVCGTCHDRLHHGIDRAERARGLRKIVRDRQFAAGRDIYEP